MTTLPGVLQNARLGWEAGTAGVTALTFMRFGEMSFAAGIMTEGRTPFRPVGNRYPTAVTPGREWTEVDVSGPATYFGFPVLLSMLMGQSTGTKLGTDAAYAWTHSASGTTATTPIPFTLDEGDANYMHRLNYLHATDLSITWNRQGIDVTGKLRGRQLVDNPGFVAGAVTQPTELLLNPANTSVYLDAAGTSLGTTQLTRVQDAKLTITDWYGPAWFLNASNASWEEPVNRAPTIELTMLFQADSTALARLSDMRAGTRRFIRINTTSTTLAGTAGGTAYYSQIVDLAGEVLKFDKYQISNDLWDLPVTFAITDDPTWGTAIAFRHVNRSGTIGSYP